ncbi:MAG: hypothetical protein HZC41_03825 [Chloroflexi bacterium]|nr:hypothetical protein [Chloroflexota bacterium]
MASTQLLPAYDTFLSFLVEKATPQEILAFQLPEDVQDHIDDLLDRHSENELTIEEAAELQQILQLDRFVSLLKAKAAYMLSKP